MPTQLTPAHVAATAAIIDLTERNLQVTLGYHQLAARLRAFLGDEVSWPAVATWASAQAGRTVRKEDLLRAIERRLGDSPAVRRLVEGPFRLAAKFVLEKILALDPFERSCQAVSRGNIKVYAEIGVECARFLALLEAGASQADHDAFAESLKPGDPPDGQALLKRAFASYRRAIALAPGIDRSQHIYCANALIGLHEQTRLQPEIEASVDGAALDGLEVKNRLVDMLLPEMAGVRGIALRIVRGRLNPYIAPIIDELRHLVREIITEKMMVLELPGEALRLGRDLTGEFPPNLATITLPECRAVLARFDATPDSMRASGTQDWTNLTERMHFIADLFRSRQTNKRLFEAPADIAARATA